MAKAKLTLKLLRVIYDQAKEMQRLKQIEMFAPPPARKERSAQ